MSDKSERIRSYLARVLPQDIVEAARTGALPVGALELPAALPEETHDAASVLTAKVLAGEGLTPEEETFVEAIIIPDKRPAIHIRDGDFHIDHPLWLSFNRPPVKVTIVRALASVGRVELPRHPSLPYGGTGFLVGPALLMTNRHVAEIFASGLGIRDLAFRTGQTAAVDFRRESASQAARLLSVRRVVMIHPYWDMALLEVDGLPADHPTLVLSTTDPAALKDRDVAVIGYPAFDPRNDATVQNQVFGGVYNVKRLQPGKLGPRAAVNSFGKIVSASTHDSSTLGGNSGSVVLDPDNGEVIGLHFAGLYLKANYAVPAAELARDRRIVDAGVTFRDARPGATDWDSSWREAETPASLASSGPTNTISAAGLTVTQTVPLRITLSLGDVAQPAAPVPTEAMVEPIHEPADRPREGYSKVFLGPEAPMPEPSDDAVVATTRRGEAVAHYHHFSLAMHAERRLALFTAANIDRSAALRRPEPGRDYSRAGLSGLGENDQEKWFPDTRYDGRAQLPDRFFTKDRAAFDKGHIVRREDVAWGSSFAEIQAANGDTYHATNCSPQIAGFNQSARGVENWGDLENYIAEESRSERLSQFAGPILAADDPVFIGVDNEGPVQVRIPRAYWKVVLAARDGRLQAYAFVLTQDLSATPMEFIVDAVWRRHLVSVADLQARLGSVRFHELIHKADQFATKAGERIRAAAEAA